MKKVFVVVLVVVAVAFASIAWAQYGGNGGGAGRGGAGGGRGAGGMGGGMMGGSLSMAVMTPPAAGIDMFATALTLTADQKAKLKDILTKSEAYIQPLQKKATDNTQALREALFAATFDTAKVVRLTNTGKTLEAQIIDARVNTWAQIRAIPLTTEQLTKLQQGGAMMFRGRMGGGGGGGFGGGRTPGAGGANPPGGGNGAPPPPGDGPPPPPPGE